jgi:hypothetical protein
MGHVTHLAEKRTAYYVGHPGGKRPLRRHKRRWENNVKMYVVGWDGVKVKVIPGLN